MNKFWWLIIYTFCLVFTYDNLAIDLSRVLIEDGQTVAIYTGAFDPVHFGHDEVIRYALNRGIDFVFVVPIEKYNPFKPYMSDVSIRHRMLQDLYQSEEKVITTEWYYPQIIEHLERLNKKIKIIAILGSDNFLRSVEQSKVPKLKADEWLVVVRDDDKDNDLLDQKELGSKPVIFADRLQMHYQGYSSTAVKRFLNEHLSFYDGSYNPTYEELPLFDSTREFIRKHQLYRNL